MQKRINFPIASAIYYYLSASCSLIFPLFRNIVLSHKILISCAICDAINTVLPCSLYSRSSLRISTTPSASSPLNGSSSIYILWSSIIACAIPSRCLIPRLYLPTCLLSPGSSPTNFIASLIRSSGILVPISDNIFRL